MTSTRHDRFYFITAQKHDLEDWYLDAFVKLCERGRPLTLEEGEQLGLLETVRVSAIRHKLHIHGYRMRGYTRSEYEAASDIAVSPEQRDHIRVELGLQPQLAPPSTGPDAACLNSRVMERITSLPPFNLGPEVPLVRDIRRSPTYPRPFESPSPPQSIYD